MTVVSWKAQWAGWVDPSPIAKYATSAVAFAAGVILTVSIPSIGVDHWSWFAAGIVLVVLTTVAAFTMSRYRELWRYDLVIPAVSLVAVALFRLGTNSDNPVIILLAVGPVLWFAGAPGTRNIGFATLGSVLALVVPVLIEDHHVDLTRQLAISSFATLVLAMMAFIFNGFSSGLRQQAKALGELATHRDDLLQESLQYSQQLEKSEFDRGAAERMFRGVWEAVTEQAVIGTDLRGRVDAWNPGAERLLGWTAGDAEESLHVVELHVPAELDEHSRLVKPEMVDDGLAPGFAALVESARSGRPDVRDWTYVRADGTHFPVQVSITRRLGVAGEAVGYLFVANDMTRLREVARLKDEFVGLISHELRTPLSSILGYLELMRDDDDAGLSENQLQYLGVAERNAHRLLRLVGDLLFTAQVESGRFQLDKQAMELAPIVAASVETIRPIAIAAGIHVVSNVAEGVFVAADVIRLGQAVDNLVSNAVKFTPRGGTVTVSVEKSGKDVVIVVQDTGMGIAASELDKLFSRFFRATTATRNAVPGVGLGLTITKAIVLAHDGILKVDSEEGVGTWFSITLPSVRAPQSVRS